VELVYVFWYGCGTCRKLDPAVDQYLRSLPGDVRAFKIHAMYEPNTLWMTHARLFWTLETLGKEEELHQAIFAEVQDKGGTDPESGHAMAGLTDPESMARFAESKGIPREEFAAAWNSPETEQKFRKALDYISNLDLDAVPGMGVNGRYAFSISKGGAGRFFETAQRLIEDERGSLPDGGGASTEAAPSGPPAEQE
jgi:thiol:disulfide interchange protein DsbA